MIAARGAPRLAIALPLVLTVMAATGNATPSRCPAEGPNLVRNGSFEEPRRDPRTHFRIVPAGERIGAWSVGSGAVDHIAPDFWEAAHGRQSLDVNSCGPAAVSQLVATRPGDSYLLCFAIAGNPDAPPAEKRLTVLWEGAALTTVEFDATSATRERMGWTYHRYVVRASGPHAVLSFRSLTPGCYGPVLDDVTLRRLPDVAWVP